MRTAYYTGCQLDRVLYLRNCVRINANVVPKSFPFFSLSFLSFFFLLRFQYATSLPEINGKIRLFRTLRVTVTSS